MRCRSAAVAAAALLCAHGAALAEGRQRGPIDVKPGPNAIVRALAKARGGDTIRIHAGTYRESFTVSKPVRIVGAKGERRPIIDGRCRTGIVVDVRRSGVVLDRLSVRGAAKGFGVPPIAVNFAGVAKGRANQLTVKESCGDAEYGINVFDSERVTVTASVARGYSDAGIYVGEIASTAGGALSVRGNRTLANNRGIIIENVSGGNVVVESNEVTKNTISGEGAPTGIFLHNSDGVHLFDNDVSANGELGIHLDPDSDRNILSSNVVSNNPANLLDEGADNYGSGNRFGDAGNLLPPC